MWMDNTSVTKFSFGSQHQACYSSNSFRWKINLATFQLLPKPKTKLSFLLINSQLCLNYSNLMYNAALAVIQRSVEHYGYCKSWKLHKYDLGMGLVLYIIKWKILLQFPNSNYVFNASHTCLVWLRINSNAIHK